VSTAIASFELVEVEEEQEENELDIPIGFLGSTISSVFIFWQFMPWLFPLIEFEGIGIQQKIRKGMITIIVTFVVGLFVIAFYNQFFL